MTGEHIVLNDVKHLQCDGGDASPQLRITWEAQMIWYGSVTW
jgi:hypothetical protein